MREILYQNAVLTLRTMNILLAVGFLFTGAFVIRFVNRHKMNTGFLSDDFLYVVLAGLVGGRLFYVAENFSAFQSDPLSALYIWDLKFSFFGVMFAAVLTLFFAARKAKEDFWVWFDALFLSSLAMLFFVHLGNFFAGFQYGLPTDLPWGISFENDRIPFVRPIHPTQLYAALLTLLLLAYSVKKSKRIHLSGVVGTRALMIYSLGMLGIDFLHGDPSLYAKIAYGVVALLAFIAHVNCGHKTHVKST